MSLIARSSLLLLVSIVAGLAALAGCDDGPTLRRATITRQTAGAATGTSPGADVVSGDDAFIADGTDGADGDDGAVDDATATIPDITEPNPLDDDVVAADDASADDTVGLPGDTETPPDPEPDPEPVPALGTSDDPHPVPRFPWVVDHSTLGAPSDRVDTWSCAPDTQERGPERFYRIDVPTSGTLVVEIREADGVDVDVHLLDRLPGVETRTLAPCVARANTRLEREVGAGTWWIAVDSWTTAAGVEKAGAYTIAFELTVLDAWQVHEVAPGVVWKRKVYSNYAGGRQTINALDIDPAQAELRPHWTGNCIRPSNVGKALGAIAAINVGFFDTGPGTCPSLDLVKIAGVVRAYNRLTGGSQRSFGVDQAFAPMFAWVEADRDWPDAWHAVGSYPNLVTDGAVDIRPNKSTDFFVGRHPRTALGVTASGRVLLVTVDGRTTAGRGMSIGALAQHMLNLGAVEAVNFDGGGSTTMWIDGFSINGIVNFPSDNATADHYGERRVSDVLVVLPR